MPVVRINGIKTNCIALPSTPTPQSAELEIQNPVSEQYIEFWNDDRFEITYNVYGAWSVQNLFTYDGHNMYSSPQITHSQKSEVYIKNITDNSILIKIPYKSETEGSDYDFGDIYIDNILIKTSIGGSAEGITNSFNIPSNSTLTISYRKDGSQSTGADNIGILIYEIKE